MYEFFIDLLVCHNYISIQQRLKTDVCYSQRLHAKTDTFYKTKQKKIQQNISVHQMPRCLDICLNV